MYNKLLSFSLAVAPDVMTMICILQLANSLNWKQSLD